MQVTFKIKHQREITLDVKGGPWTKDENGIIRGPIVDCDNHMSIALDKDLHRHYACFEVEYEGKYYSTLADFFNRTLDMNECEHAPNVYDNLYGPRPI